MWRNVGLAVFDDGMRLLFDDWRYRAVAGARTFRIELGRGLAGGKALRSSEFHGNSDRLG